MKTTTIVAILLAIAPAAGAECGLPAEYVHARVVDDGDLRVTFAADHETFAPGDKAGFAILVQNRGSSTYSVNWNLEPMDGVFVLPASCTQLTFDCYFQAVFQYPRILHTFSPGLTLAPGQCRTWIVEWPTSSFPAPPGHYNALGGLYDPRPIQESGLGEFRVPAGGVLLPLTLDDGTPARVTTWGRLKATHH